MKKILPLALIASLISGVAFAHPGHIETNNMIEGALHPLIGIDHIVFMVAIGLWASLYNGLKAFALPIGFVSGMLIGMMIAYFGYNLSYAETIIGLSIVIGGVALAFNRNISAIGGGSFALFVGMFHGHAHGVEATHLTFEFMIGALVSTIIMHIIGAIFGLKFTQIRKFTPYIGGAMAIAGAFVLAS